MVLSLSATAQTSMDPSSALLLSPGARANTGRLSDKATTETTRTESTRYTVRPRTEKSSTSTPTQTKHVETPRPTPAPVVLAPGEQGAVVVAIDAPTVSPTPTPPAVAVAEEPKPSIRHLLDIAVSSAYLYESAESNYSFRQATMGGPAYAASARAWIIPEFAIGGSYLSTLGGQISDRGSALSASRTALTYGLYFRKAFAESNLIFAAEYLETDFKVSSDAVSKLKTKSAGVRVSIEGEFQSQNASWTFGFSVIPKLQHDESAAATEVRSGSSVNAYSVGASIMCGWKFDASNAAFVRVEHRLERDLFTGSATLADPVGGATPNGVSATVGTTLIQFGYSWGD